MTGMRTSIQISKEEDRQIEQLKALLKLPSKKAVVLEALRELWDRYRQNRRSERLKAASLLCREGSLRVSREMSPLGTGTKIP
jgi:hypothetical protein